MFNISISCVLCSWYDEATAQIFAQEALEQSNGGPIAFVSTPAAFIALKVTFIGVYETLVIS